MATLVISPNKYLSMLLPCPVPQFLHLWLIPASPAWDSKKTVAQVCEILSLAEEGPAAEESVGCESW